MRISKSIAVVPLAAGAVCGSNLANAAEWNVRLGGYIESHIAHVTAEELRERSSDGTFTRPAITLDNGLRISSRIEFEDESGDSIDEPQTRIRGSFGSILSVEDDTDASPDDYGTYSVGLSDLTENSLTFGVTFDQTGETQHGFLATERPAGTLVNPALNFQSSFTGYTIESNYSTSLNKLGVDLGRDYYLNVGASYSHWDANAYATGDQFINGFGIPAVGIAPGVFAGFPTDLIDGSYGADRDRFGTSASLSHFYTVEPIGPGTIGYTGGTAGLRLGTIRHAEWSVLNLDTPLFGANSGTAIKYDTEIDSVYGGGFVGLNAGVIRITADGWRQSAEITGGLGINYYSLNVSDVVVANGLGGAINLNQATTFNEGAIQLDGGIGLNAAIGRNNWDLTLNAAYKFNNQPSFDVHRADSTNAGTPIRTAVDVSTLHSFHIGTGFKVSF